MLCSINKIETPDSWIPRISWMIVSISVGFRPAITSSRRSSDGPVASARASSRRLRSARVSADAATRSRAVSPTRATTSRACASASRARARPGNSSFAARRPRQRTLQARVRALGEEQDDADQEHAVGDQVSAVQSALPEIEPGDLGERREDEGAEDRSQERAGAAHDRPDDDLDRERDAEERVGLEREEIERVEGAAQPGEKRRHDHRQHLVLEGVHAERLGRGFVLADRGQVDAEAPPLDRPGRHGRHEHERQRDVVVGAAVLELELSRVARERDVEPERAAERVDVRDRDAADLRERDGEQHEVEAAQAETEAEIADDRAEQRRERAPDEHADPRRQLKLDRQHRRRVAADADESRMAGRELPRVAPDDVPGLAEESVEEDQDEQGQRVRAQDRRQRDQRHQRARERPLHDARRPKRPAGRSSKITIRSEKLNSSLSDGLRNTAPSDSASETRSPPTNAPRRLPMPPMITMLNEATDRDSPVGG